MKNQILLLPEEDFSLKEKMGRRILKKVREYTKNAE